MITGRVRTLAGLVLAGLLLVGTAPSSVRAVPAGPRVVIVVGPVGALTDTYRQWARQGAAEARRWTTDVVEVYSPDATWTRVRGALQGASVVVYLGHGNGFPSPYGSTLRPAVQDGFGLNPVAGRGDDAHQYFGEGVIARQVRLAPGAVVLLFHLCYASGLAEPGVAEGTLADARARVDNFAAGFLAAGASGVVADAYGSPAGYLRTLLGDRRPVRTAWDLSPTANRHVVAFASQRTTGAVALLDPEQVSSGYTRSLVLAKGAVGYVPAAPRPGPGTGPGGWEIVLPPEPSVAPDAFDLGARPGTPTIVGTPLAGASVQLRVPVAVPSGVTLGTAYRLGTRWIPLDAAGVAGDTAAPASPVAASPGAPPANPGAASPGAPPASPGAATAGDTALVARESAATLVDVVAAVVAGGAIGGTVDLPAVSGRYRLEVTVHDRDGIALPYAVQASIPGVVVHVGGPGAAWIDAPPAVTLSAGSLASLQVAVTNGEATAWGGCAPAPRHYGPDTGGGCPAVRVVGRWVGVDSVADAPPLVRQVEVPAAAARTTWLSGMVPAVPGTYLLVVSVERSRGDGSLEVLGRPVTVTVGVVGAPLVPTPPGG